MLRKIVPVIIARLFMGGIGAAVAWVVCSTMLRVPGVAGYPFAEAITVACGVVVVTMALFAPAGGEFRRDE
jgi:hypothetical protein